MKLFQYLFIRFFHGILSNLPFTIVRALAYPIGIIYFIFTFRSSTLLYKRRIEIFKPNDLQYNPLMVKINYSRYWLETLWLTSRNYEKSISNKIEIINFENIFRFKLIHGK